MKVVAKVMGVERPDGLTGDTVRFILSYLCSDGTLSSSLNVDVDASQVEANVNVDLKTAVKDDVNTRLGTSLNVADVRLFGVI